MVSSGYEELGDFVGRPYSMDHTVKGGEVTISLTREGLAKQARMRIEKNIVVGRKKEVRVDYLIEGSYEGLFALEMNISFLGSPHALIRAGDKTITIKSSGIHEKTREFSLTDKFLGLGVDFVFDEKIDLWHYPVETVSLSEQGIERLYQGTAFLFVTDLDLQGGKKKLGRKKKLGFTIKIMEDNR
jgi:alpha-amylase